MNILEVEGLCKTYPAFALRDVSFAVEPGTIMGFIGRNGAGKSTTIKSMLNLVHPDSGRVTMFGQDFYANEPACKQQLGVVLGGVDFYPNKKLRSILFSTHITSDLEKCASHITMIKDGQILCSDTRDGFLARYRAQFGDGQMSLEDILVRVERRSYDSEDFL